MAKVADTQKQALLYQQLIMQGVPAAEAFKQAFPSGIPTALDRAKEQAKANQQAGLGQLGGTLVGALGSKAVYDAVTGKPILGGIFNSTTGAAANAATSTAANTASSAAPEILSATRIPTAAGETSTFSNIAGSATPYLGAVGAAAGAYGAYEGIKNKDPVKAGLSGLGGMAGISAMGYMIPGWGWVAAAAAPAILAALNGMGDKDRWKEEQSAVGKLASSGVTGWADFQKTLPQLSRGRSIDELVQIERDKAARGQYSNEAFARSRNVADLKPEDIWGYSAFGNKFGNDWFGKYNEAQRREIADAALKSGAVQESKGQISIDWGKVNLPQFTTAQTTQESERLKREKLKQNSQLGNKIVGALS